MSRPQLGHLPDRHFNAIPQTFKCLVDGQWHGPDHFSKSQLAKWAKKKKFANDGVTPENIGLICKNHSQQPIAEREIKCHGPCGAWKHKEHFSKNQRNEAGAWCTTCSVWANNFDGDETPHAAPGEQLQPHEVVAQTTTVQDHVPGITDRYVPNGTAQELLGGSVLGQQSTYGDTGDDDFADVEGSVIGTAVAMMRSTPFFDENDGEEEDISDDISVATLTSHSKLKDELEFLRGSHASSAQPDSRGRTMTMESSSRLYSDNAFSIDKDMDGYTDDYSDAGTDTTTDFSYDITEEIAESNAEGISEDMSEDASEGASEGISERNTEDVTADITTPKASEAEVVRPVRIASVPSKKWFKGDTRKVFYAPQNYAERPADNTNIRGPIEDSDDDDVDF
ncbi:hypothetical protein F5Y13DRAFT_35210 [Hypoxylon sp. FL1857]|nr:hypothetical protein F5Y13DRAFT_35210 [Hypoxylon sp. FL1857]